MLMPLLQTKLHAPAFQSRSERSKHVSRQRLIQKLDSGFTKKLTMVCAPAGFGKSTLLSEWIHQDTERNERMHQAQTMRMPFRVAWLTLDASDNDPIRFWTYFVAALQTVDDEIGTRTLALLQSPHLPSPELLLSSLLSDLANRPDLLVLVLDDYQVITAPAIHQALLFLLDHLPPQWRIVLSSRIMPPWPLARWRGQGELVELHSDALRFTTDEAASFLSNVMGIELSEIELAALESRTEGWIVGLQLAALSLQGMVDREKFIALFSGSNRYIVDYLMEEVLSQQPPEIHSFMLQTSILDQLCGPLCDAVLGQGEITEQNSYMTGESSQAILERLEHANLFVVPLDNDRKWYRYHHLFAEVLRHRLRHSHSGMIAELHHRASLWYEEAGQIEAAVGHALAAPDVERAAMLVENVAMSILFHRSEIVVARQLIERIPISAIHLRPQLILAYGITLALFGQSTEIEQLLLNAAPALNSPNLSAEISGGLLVLHSTVARFHEDTLRSFELAQQALEQLPSHTHALRSAAVLAVGLYYLQQREHLAGQQALAEAISLAVAGGAEYLALAAFEEMATHQAQQGQLAQAKRTCEEAITQGIRWGVQRMPATGLAYIGLGEILCEWNELEDATRALTHGIQQLQGTTEMNLWVRGYVALARTQQALDQADEALLTLHQAEQWLTHVQITGSRSQRSLEMHQARLALLQGDFDTALRWVELTQVATDTLRGCMEQLTWVRINLAHHQLNSHEHFYTEAKQMLTHLLAVAEFNGWASLQLENWLLQAYIHQAQGDRVAAQSALMQALTMAEPQGYVRIFVDEGESIRPMLLELKTALVSKPPERMQQRLLLYANKLLAALGAVPLLESVTVKTPAQPRPAVQNLVEPLTGRELEILRLVNQGCSNSEIASTLIVTVGTVKKHLNNIFGKLGVSSRTQALVSAHSLDLL